MAEEEPEYTLGEKLHIAAVIALGAKRSLALGADQPDIDRKLDRIKKQALKRSKKK